MHKSAVCLAAALMGASLCAVAHNAETHRDATAYAFELMAVAGKEEMRQRFAGNAEMVQFIDAMTAAVRFYEGLPADLPAPHRDRCVDLEVMKRFARFLAVGRRRRVEARGHISGAGGYPVFLERQELRCRCLLARGHALSAFLSTEQTHAGNVLGLVRAHGRIMGDIEMEARITTPRAPRRSSRSLRRRAAQRPARYG
jgi:hypothetical protein